MDSQIGLDYIVENKEYTAKLALALDTENVTVKKQVFELLSAVCVYSQEGHARAIEALDIYKNTKKEKYKFQFIINELKNSTSFEYQLELLAFINCLIVSVPQLKDRIRLRNELIGLKLHDILSQFQKTAASKPTDKQSQELRVQLDVYNEQREGDEAANRTQNCGVDLNSHLDVFYAILQQVVDTPQESTFLNILQHLLSVDPKESACNTIWNVSETLVHRASLLESQEDAIRLLNSHLPKQMGERTCYCSCHRDSTDNGSKRKQSATLDTARPLVLPPIAAAPPPPPPPPPPPMGMGGPPPPPPPPPIMKPPPLVTERKKMSQVRTLTSPISENENIAASDSRLPQQETPKPKAKMKTLNWNKIPSNKVVGKNNIWSLVAQNHEHSPMADLDWSEMEGLFCQTAAPSVPNTPQLITNSPRLGGNRDENRKDNSEITLLDGKKSLNVNIFLKQFRSSHEDLVKLVKEVQPDDIGAERLRGLLRLLPELDELETLLAFDGDKTRLGTAEKFLLRLIQVPNYKLRIESMLLKEEFAANMGFLEPSINAMIVAGEDLMTHRALQEVLYMVLVAGNFLNSGGYAGNAAGVKLSSLQKITDIRANKPGMNLLHFVALQAQKKNEDFLKFPEQLTALEDATKTSVDQLQNDINTLDVRIKKIQKQIDMPSTEQEIKKQMSEFLQIAEQEISTLKRDMTELEEVKKELAEFFCEDLASFKLEECFRILHTFCTKFRAAVQDNARRVLQDQQAAARRRQREEQLAGKRRQMYPGEPEPLFGFLTQKKSFDKDPKTRKLAQNGSLQNSGLSEEEISVTSSPIVTRRRTGSFSGPSGDLAQAHNAFSGPVTDLSLAAQSMREENYSPDVTPNGTLRRRRSRVPSEEDDGSLMDFLRGQQTTEVITKDRKSWGSLDRSWARRARGGGRKRADLLSADFSDDRERPNSPSFPAVNQDSTKAPLTAGLSDPTRPPAVSGLIQSEAARSPSTIHKGIVPNEETEGNKPRAWRQKIEAWLLDSEREEKLTEEQKRRRRPPTNRRTADNISIDTTEGGSILDTLPEGKLAEQKIQSYKQVYPDWKPNIDKTDVVGAMEAIEEAQQPIIGSNIRDKSQWRKSNLNVATKKDEAEMNFKRLRRIRSRTQMQENENQPGTDQQDSKSILASLGNLEDDKLTLYMKKPQTDLNKPRPTTLYLGSGGSSAEQSPLKQPLLDSGLIRKPELTRVNERVHQDSPRPQRKEILFDNQDKSSYLRQESKVQASPGDDRSYVRLDSLIKNDCDTELGDGSRFDRFSPIRKTTRRYKKEVSPETNLQRDEPNSQNVEPSVKDIYKSDPLKELSTRSLHNVHESRKTSPFISTERNKLESQNAFDCENMMPLSKPTKSSEPVWLNKDENVGYLSTRNSENYGRNEAEKSTDSPSYYTEKTPLQSSLDQAKTPSYSSSTLPRSAADKNKIRRSSSETTAIPKNTFSLANTSSRKTPITSRALESKTPSSGGNILIKQQKPIEFSKTNSLGRKSLLKSSKPDNLDDEGFEESFSNNKLSQNSTSSLRKTTPTFLRSYAKPVNPPVVSQTTKLIPNTRTKIPSRQSTLSSYPSSTATVTRKSSFRNTDSSPLEQKKVPVRKDSSLKLGTYNSGLARSASLQRKGSFGARPTEEISPKISSTTPRVKAANPTCRKQLEHNNSQSSSRSSISSNLSANARRKNSFGTTDNLLKESELRKRLSSTKMPNLKENSRFGFGSSKVSDNQLSSPRKVMNSSRDAAVKNDTKNVSSGTPKTSLIRKSSSFRFMRPTAASTSKESAMQD